MNLVEEAWIPVVRRNGERATIAPWQLTEGFGADLEPLALAAPRPDFNGALAQLLIGLLQTALPPSGDEEWGRLLERPPAPDELHRRFSTIAPSFSLDGGGPRCFQDLCLPDGAKDKEIGALLIDSPGDQTLELNTDHFVKRHGATGMCLGCTATALYCLQTNAPAGGSGVRTSLRGGGPLTTLVVPANGASSLWRTCWLNVLTRSQLEALTGNPDRADEASLFPWLGATPTSERQGGRATTPDHMAPCHVYWGMPRRIRLRLDQLSDGECDLCGRHGSLVVRYRTQRLGINYQGPWRHPLSPYYATQDGEMLPLHPQREGLGYRDWAGVAIGDPDRGVEAAAVVRALYRRQRWLTGGERIWAFGYDMENMKARGWHEERVPVFLVPAAEVDALQAWVTDLLRAARLVADNLRSRLKEAWFNRPGDVKGDLSFATRAYWLGTGREFFTTVAELAGAAATGAEPIEPFHRWHRTLHTASLELFDTWSAADVAYANPRRVAHAQRRLISFNFQRKINGWLRRGEPAGAPGQPGR